MTAAAVYDDAHDLLLYATGHPAPWNPTQRQGDNRWTSGLVRARPGDRHGALVRRDQSARSSTRWAPAAVSLPLSWTWRGSAVPCSSIRIVTAMCMCSTAPSGEILSAAALPARDSDTWHRSDDRQFRVRMTGSGAPAARRATSAPPGRPATPRSPRSSPPPACSTFPPAVSAWTWRRATPATSPGTPVHRRQRAHAARQGRIGRCADRLGCRGRRGRPGEIAEPAPLRGGVLVTAGGVVFYGTLDGMLKAVDARSGASAVAAHGCVRHRLLAPQRSAAPDGQRLAGGAGRCRRPSSACHRPARSTCATPSAAKGFAGAAARPAAASRSQRHALCLPAAMRRALRSRCWSLLLLCRLQARAAHAAHGPAGRRGAGRRWP